MNAARSRQKTKQHIEDLNTEVNQYATRNIQLQRLNAELVRQVESLTQERDLLRQRLTVSPIQGSGLFNSGSLVSDPTLLVATATSNHALQHQHHQALLQSLSLAAPSQQTLDAPVPTRSLFPGAPDPLAASSSLASLLVKRNSLEQQRLLRSLDQQQPPNTVAGLSSSPLLNLLTPAQRLLLLSDAKHHNVGGIGGSSDSVNELSPLLLALLVQQQQRDIDESNGSSAGF
jgi:hypothetical protein